MTHTTTRIKFCGITRRVDALTAVALGVDALGFVFYRASGRWITPAAARAIIAELPPFVCTVGLFVDESPATIEEVAAETGLPPRELLHLREQLVRVGVARSAADPSRLERAPAKGWSGG